MRNSAIGQPLPRKEDLRLLTGRGRFSDDFSLEGQAYAALKAPGVLGVFTGADCAADRLRAIPHNPLPSTRYDMKLTAPGGKALFAGS